MSSLGVPGHCFGLQAELWHESGQCRNLIGCDGKCCEPSAFENPATLKLRRIALLGEVDKMLEDHPAYKNVVFKREVIGAGAVQSEILVALFTSSAGRVIAQKVLHST